VSLILCARYIHCPRWGYRCDECGRLLGPHIYLYGRAHETEPPGAMRLCVAHLTETTDPKVRAALDEATRRAPEVAAEAARLEAWNGAPRDE
jgi:hypothetical protein